MDFGGNDKRSLFVQYIQGNYANVHARIMFMPYRVVFHINTYLTLHSDRMHLLTNFGKLMGSHVLMLAKL